MFTTLLAAVLAGTAAAAPPKPMTPAKVSAPAKAHAPPNAEEHFIKTADGWAIKATYQPPSKDGPVAVLTHGLGSARGEWLAFSKDLRALGLGTLAFDLRGHGESTLTPSGRKSYTSFQSTDWIYAVRDIEAVVGFLESRGIPRSRVGLIGASLGANISALAATMVDADWLVLLSPGLNYQGVLLPTDFEKVPLVTASANQDKYSFEASLILKRNGVPLLAAQGGHGVGMFQDKAFTKALLDWIRAASR
jgi:alpha-beta hydrolase superfamily lysophospholipase